MFYKVLFVLTLYNLIKAAKSFIKDNVVIKDGKQAEISTGAYISFGLTAAYHIMVFAVCLIPTIMW